jgi:uracil phosphoribosyltransferase
MEDFWAKAIPSFIMLLDYLIWLLVVLFYKSFEISNLKLNTNAGLKFQNRQVHLSFTTCNIDYRRLQPIDIVSIKLA